MSKKITRTFTQEVVNCKVYNKTNDSLSELDVQIFDRPDKTNIEDAVRDALPPDIVLLTVEGAYSEEVKLSMPIDTFISIAKRNTTVEEDSNDGENNENTDL